MRTSTSNTIYLRFRHFSFKGWLMSTHQESKSIKIPRKPICFVFRSTKPITKKVSINLIYKCSFSSFKSFFEVTLQWHRSIYLFFRGKCKRLHLHKLTAYCSYLCRLSGVFCPLRLSDKQVLVVWEWNFLTEAIRRFPCYFRVVSKQFRA